MSGTSFSSTSFSMGDMPEIEDVLGLPIKIDADDFYDFDQFEVNAETLDGSVARWGDYEAREILQDFVDKIPTIIMSDNDSSFHMTATLEETSDNPTILVPLAWLNRVVKVTLAFGEVVGMFSDQTLRDCQFVYIEALPGKPAIPPLPVHLVHGILLLPRVFHFSLEHSLGALCEVRKYLHQQGDTLFMRELQTEVGFSHPFGKVFYDMSYEYNPDGKAGVSATFWRFPAPSHVENREAEYEDWRLRWASQTIHLSNTDCLGTYLQRYSEAEADKLVNDCVEKGHHLLEPPVPDLLEQSDAVDPAAATSTLKDIE